MTATVSYVGNVGRHEQFGIPLNQAIPGPGSFNPRRPLYQKFGISQGVNDASNAASNSYNALQSKMTKRFSHGLSFLGAFTWGRSFDIGTTRGSQAQDFYNINGSYGPSDFDVPRHLVLSYIYDLPFGHFPQCS